MGDAPPSLQRFLSTLQERLADMPADEYQDVYKLTYLRGPSGIIARLAQELKRT